MRRQLRAWRQEFGGMWGRLRSFHRVALGITLAMGVMLGGRPYLYDTLKAAVREKREALKKMDAPESIPRPDDDPDSVELRLRIEGLEKGMDARRKERQQAVAAWPAFGKAEKGAIIARFDDLIAQSGLERLEFRDSALPAAPPASAARDPAAAAAEKAKAERERREAERRAQAEKDKAAKAAEKAAEKSATEKKPAKAKAEKPKPKDAFATAVHGYVLAGPFASVRRFLEAADTFAYPARLENVRLELADPAGTPPPGQRAGPVIHLSFNLKLYLND
jgi:translation initiation factor IF-2